MLSEADKCIWISPTGVGHFVCEQRLRTLARDESLSYDKMAKHCERKPLGATGRRPAHVSGWQVARTSTWLRNGDQLVCIAPPISTTASARTFVEMVNSSPLHPLRGVFNQDSDSDMTRLTHLVNSRWVWSNSEKVSHMHGWSLVDAPDHPEQHLPQVQPPSPYTFPVR